MNLYILRFRPSFPMQDEQGRIKFGRPLRERIEIFEAQTDVEAREVANKKLRGENPYDSRLSRVSEETPLPLP